MIIEPVTYWRIPRSVDNKPSYLFDRAFTMALRWQPEELLGDEMHLKGEVALRSLQAGHDVSVRNLRLALSYLTEAIEYYRQAPEPYAGRNDEACSDLQELHDELHSAVGLSVGVVELQQ